MTQQALEQRFLNAVDRATVGLPDYERGVTATFALAAFRAGYRLGLNGAPVEGTTSARREQCAI